MTSHNRTRNVAQGDSIQTEETQSPTEDTSVDTSAAAQDEAAEVFLNDTEEEVQTPPEEFVFVGSPEDTATDGVDQAELLRDQEQSPVLTQTVSEEVTICNVPRDASTTQETETHVDDFFQMKEIQSPKYDTSVLFSAAAQDEAAEVFLDNIEEEVQTPPEEFVYLETCEDTDGVEQAALLNAIEEEVQTPPEEFVFVESPEDTLTDGVDQAEFLRDQEQSPVLTQTVSEEVMVCDVPRDASTTPEMETDVHEEVDESQQDQEYSVAEDDFFQTEEIQSPTEDTSVLSSAAAQDEAAEVFLDNIEEEVQTPPEEFVYLETFKDTFTDGVEQAALLSDQEQSPEVAQTENEDVTVHKVLDQSKDDHTTNFEETVGTFEDLTTLTTQETVVNDTVSATSQPDIITEDMSESSESSSSTDTFTEPSRISPTVLKGSYFITNALTQKLFKLAGSKDHRNASLMGARLHYSIKQQLELDENCQMKLKNLEKVGKAAAKCLSAEYGSADAVLRAAREDDTAAFEAAAAEHINAELRSFQKRPKSALSRLFSRMRKAFTF
ncbi:unnamed protein product [Knipowitschia caucasica]|uniref:Uncharacterized protein n=1 Tax=Knipowitschia caucasica TaxID=637954 RepID=A0AAV2MFE6_KNICA